jgi:hypothetical protein
VEKKRSADQAEADTRRDERNEHGRREAREDDE